MPFEADLAHALDRTTDSLEPDLTTLTSGAVERGRSRSRRRRSAGALAGVGACAAIAAAGLVLPGVLAGARSAGSDMEAVALAMPRSAISGPQMIDAVKKTFPGSRFGREDGQSNDPSNPSKGWVAKGGVDVNDGHGTANVGVSALRLKLPLRDGEGLNCDNTAGRAEAGDTCELSELPSSATLPGGALVMSEKIAERQPIGADPVPGSALAHRWTTTVTLKSTGAQLQMVQWNTAGDFGSGNRPKPTRDAPPLSQKQAVAALTGPTWAPILGAVG
ncbi:hypothetical protein [Streptomyces benahoarensis]|uniref:Uncharacterized protein n=1 Tax=Streptomyces benahoarensis TaxID=2595054 RepID=A0A553Z5A9_9ACTN|nr:hypothetical protein [Streptomyces benahoarensis]TSB20132.1 hypothetical protein FNJ62_21350 [Streptomyces benahoarensis]TSB36646.1 hypothetical protein FNZ23_19590 [Streptomyces benahoarensis]